VSRPEVRAVFTELYAAWDDNDADACATDYRDGDARVTRPSAMARPSCCMTRTERCGTLSK
jgi:hypothetical protein